MEIGRALDLTDERKQYQENYVPPKQNRFLFGMVHRLANQRNSNHQVSVVKNSRAHKKFKLQKFDST